MTLRPAWLPRRRSTASRWINACANRLERGRKTRPFSGPVDLVLHATDRCTLSCAMCMNSGSRVNWPAEGTHSPSPDFGIGEFREVLELWPTLRTVCFAGVGEPLLNESLREMALLAHEVGLKTELITNGTELTEHAEWLSGGAIESVSVSVNAWSEASMAKHCGVPGTVFERVRSGIEALVSARQSTGYPCELSLSTVLWSGRQGDAAEVLVLANSLDVPVVYFHALIPSSIPGFGPESMLTDADRPWLEELVSLGNAMGLGVIVPEVVVPSAPTSRCSSPWRCLYVDAAGGVSGCMRVETPSTMNGDWRDPRVWHGQYYTGLRRAHTLGGIEVPERCRFCVEAHRH